MANYTNVTNISEYLQRALTANETTALNSFILDAVDLWIDNALNSSFHDVAATTRYYESDGKNLDVDPCTVITAVASVDNDNTVQYTYATNEYILEPKNVTVKREIRLRGTYPCGEENIAVTAKFSEYDGEVPADIVLVATRIAGGIINAGKEAGVGEDISSESLEGHSISYSTSNASINTVATSDPILKGILDSRKEIMIW